MPRTSLVRALLVPVLLISLAACGNDTSTVASAPPSPTVAAATVAPTTAALSSPSVAASPQDPAVAAADKTFEISVDGGTSSGDTGRLKVAVGDSVAITVTSTSPDEVHLHGYDVSVPVGAGQPAVLTFEATIPGVFALELEDAGVALASLQVQ